MFTLYGTKVGLLPTLSVTLEIVAVALALPAPPAPPAPPPPPPDLIVPLLTKVTATLPATSSALPPVPPFAPPPAPSILPLFVTVIEPTPLVSIVKAALDELVEPTVCEAFTTNCLG